MHINIRISEEMDKADKWNECIEDRTIRMAGPCQERHGYKVGDFVSLRSRWGSLIVLQVAEAHPIDAATDPTCGYVTSKNSSVLFMLNRDMTEVTPVDGITLGCDPEAFLWNRVTRSITSAYRFTRKLGSVGHDGILLEFRPCPSTNENVVVENLRELIVRAREILNRHLEGPQIDILAASAIGKLTAGFHLHFGLPRRLLYNKGGNVEIKTIATLMTKALDYYVGIPSIIPEGNEDSTRRTLSFVAYGKPGEYRIDNRTFEYRMPGGTNLRHPCLTRGLLALGATVVEDFVSRLNVCTDSFCNLKIISCMQDLEKIYPNLPSTEEMYHMVCNRDISSARYRFEAIKEDVRKMVGYKNRSGSIEQYFDCIDKNVPFDNNIELNWGGLDNESKRQVVFLQNA